MLRILVVLALLLPSAAEAAVKLVPFTELRKGDTLWVTYQSSGCFHSYKADFTFYGREPNVAHMKYWNFFLHTPKEPDARTVTLTAEDRRGLDSLVAAYRRQVDERSTSVKVITFTSSRKGRRSDPVRFVDRSSLPYGLLTLDDLIRRGAPPSQ